jgi:hypothetical protein
VTFGKLLLDIRRTAQEFFPGVKLRLVGWWWTPEEHALFKEWADRQAPGAFPSLARHIQYGRTAPIGDAVLPADCQGHAFVHIGYADAAKPSDVYGAWGPVISPVRIPRTVEGLLTGGATGLVAYSEGVFDDANQALLGGLSSGKFSSAPEVLECYAERYFGAAGRRRADWAEWLRQWGRPFEVDASSAAKGFQKLARGATAGWRLAGWEARVRLFEANQEALSGRTWDERRLAAGRRFLEHQERLFRDVWKLGLLRAVLNPRFHRPAWFAQYEQASGRGARGRGQGRQEA